MLTRTGNSVGKVGGEGFCEHSNELLAYIKGREYLD
jgi:hypothetical protein